MNKWKKNKTKQAPQKKVHFFVLWLNRKKNKKKFVALTTVFDEQKKISLPDYKIPRSSYVLAITTVIISTAATTTVTFSCINLPYFFHFTWNTHLQIGKQTRRKKMEKFPIKIKEIFCRKKKILFALIFFSHISYHIISICLEIFFFSSTYWSMVNTHDSLSIK